MKKSLKVLVMMLVVVIATAVLFNIALIANASVPIKIYNGNSPKAFFIIAHNLSVMGKVQ